MLDHSPEIKWLQIYLVSLRFIKQQFGRFPKAEVFHLSIIVQGFHVPE
jgi:hypothetical protein